MLRFWVKRTAVFALSLLSVFLVKAEVVKWSLDKAHTSIGFSLRHLVATSTGMFRDFDGELDLDKDNLANCSAWLRIKVNSINTQNEQRDNHLKGADFFDAHQYPEIVFKSTKFEKKSDKEYLVYGDLTIKNTTKKVSLPLKVSGEMAHPMKQGLYVLGMSAQTLINREEYGVGTSMFAKALGDEVTVTINLELNTKK